MPAGTGVFVESADGRGEPRVINPSYLRRVEADTWLPTRRSRTFQPMTGIAKDGDDEGEGAAGGGDGAGGAGAGTPSASGRAYGGCVSFLLDAVAAVMGDSCDGGTTADGTPIFNIYVVPIPADRLSCGVGGYTRNSPISTDRSLMDDVLRIPKNMAGWLLVIVPTQVLLPLSLFANFATRRNKAMQTGTGGDDA
jgi:hypothetical protein